MSANLTPGALGSSTHFTSPAGRKTGALVSFGALAAPCARTNPAERKTRMAVRTNFIGSLLRFDALLLVVDGRVVHRRIVAGCRDGARLAVGGDSDLSGQYRLSALLRGEAQRVLAHDRVRPRVVIRRARGRIVLAVELAGPLIVRGFAILVDAVGSDLDHVAGGRVDDRGVLGGTGRELGLGFVQLPGAHL